MSQRYIGGFITKSPTTPTSTAAPGVWTLDQAMQYIKAGTWPLTYDPYFDYTTLLLPGNGTNGAQNNTFLDSSTNAFSITRNGNTTQGTFSPFSQTGWGVYFDGTGDYISVPDSADFTMGSGDFTIQCWVYSSKNSSSDQYICGQVPASGAGSSTSFQLYKKATTNVAECYVYIGGAKVATSTTVIPIGQWTHLAMVRDGATMRLYVNGVQEGTNATLSTSSIVDSSGSFAVGRTGDYDGLYFDGYVSNVSVVKGTCLFPNGTTFTPSTTPLSTSTSGQSVLLCQPNRFIDTNTATTAKTVTVGGDSKVQAFSPFAPTAAYSAGTNGGSGYFDGSGDYLSFTTSSSFAISGDFTIEFWAYFTATGTYQPLINQYTDAGFLLRVSPGSTIDGDFYINSANGSDGIASFSGAACPVNAWNFFRLIRSGSTVTVYCNGVSVGSRTRTGNIFANSKTLGIANYSTSYFTGYLSGIKIISSAATGTEVPTAPPSPTSSSLCLNFTNAGIYDATAKNDLETVGNAQISNAQAKWGSTSMYFDGTGDYLTAPNTPLFGLEGDFTVECWAYFVVSPSGGGASYIIDFRSGSVNNFTFGVVDSSGTKLYAYGNSGAIQIVGTSALSTSTWYHIAYVRYGSTLTVYLNGIACGSGTTTYSQPATSAVIGARYNGAQEYVNGYIQDLRITKGYARYTANFTAPTAPFQLY